MSNLLNQNNWSPPYQMGGANFTPYMNQPWPSQQQRLPVYSAQPIHGHDAAMQFPMAPNSEIYLPDANQDIIWWIRTDNMGNHLVQGFDIKLHQEPTPVDTNDLAARLAAVEEWINAKSNKSNAKRVQSNSAAATEPIA